ncbi:MAG TPA: hypothetical protein VKR06_05240 [Ktedonosporobacter sp.]|nr:hypothetical protein [Ktedonosporobacter sp.]
MFEKEIGGGSQQTPEHQLPIIEPIIGYRYRSEAILSEDAATPAQDGIELLDNLELLGQPGTRVPHLWVEREGRRISTLDLLDGRFVLLTGPDGTPWHEATQAVAAGQGISLAAYSLGPNADLRDPENGWPTKMGISAEGAVLVRPDGFVAWRTSTLPTNPSQQLEQVFAYILGRANKA